MTRPPRVQGNRDIRGVVGVVGILGEGRETLKTTSKGYGMVAMQVVEVVGVGVVEVEIVAT